MLNEIHSALEQLIFEYGRIERDEIDVQFDAPTKEWISTLTRPTVDLFLFDIRENTEKRETNLHTVRGNGKAERRLAPRRIDLRYMVGVLTTDIEDEHQLLWRLLSILMKYPQLPPESLPESLRSLEPPIVTRIEDKDETGRLLELWNAFGVPPRPALCYIVTVPLDLDIALQAPLVLTRTARYLRTAMGDAAIEKGVHIGGIVRDKAGLPVADVAVRLESSAAEGVTTDKKGQFVLRGVSEGLITLNVLQAGKVRQRVKVNVPGESYDIVLDGEDVEIH